MTLIFDSSILDDAILLDDPDSIFGADILDELGIEYEARRFPESPLFADFEIVDLDDEIPF